MDEENIHPITVFAGNINEALIVKSLLENAEIAVYLKDEFQGTLTPWVVTAGGMGSVKVTVSNNDEDVAKQVVAEYLGNKNTTFTEFPQAE